MLQLTESHLTKILGLKLGPAIKLRISIRELIQRSLSACLSRRPGVTKTDMTSGVKEKYDKLLAEGIVPQKRWGHPEDVGLAVESILGGAFPFSTGDVINIDGGFHLKRL